MQDHDEKEVRITLVEEHGQGYLHCSSLATTWSYVDTKCTKEDSMIGIDIKLEQAETSISNKKRK